MNNDTFEEAVQLYKTGKIEEAKNILITLVKQNPKSEGAWLWLSVCISDNEQKQYCLKKVLELNPNNPNALLLLNGINEKAKQAIEFLKAKCPYCDGELRVPRNRENIKCMYCGGDIIVQKNNLMAVKPKNTVDHLLTLAVAAENAKNYEEAFKYYSQVLEQDSNIPVAWIGKGISAGWLSSVQAQRIDEAITCIRKGLDANSSDSNLIEHAAINLILITQSYTEAICKYLADKHEAEMSFRTGGVILDPVTSGLIISVRRSAADKKINNEFWQTYCPVIMRACYLSWRLFGSIEIATGIYNTINTVNNSYVFGSNVKSGFEEGLQKTLLAIKDKFPQLKPPKRKKDCFIATATMGNYNHPYVIMLRRYRDHNLLHNNIGEAIVQAYYRISPPIAKAIENNSLLRTLSLHLIIKPSIFLVNIAFAQRERRRKN